MEFKFYLEFYKSNDMYTDARITGQSRTQVLKCSGASRVKAPGFGGRRPTPINLADANAPGPSTVGAAAAAAAAVPAAPAPAAAAKSAGPTH